MGNSQPNMVDPDGGWGGGYSAANPFLGSGASGGAAGAGLGIAATFMNLQMAGDAMAMARAIGGLNLSSSSGRD